MILQRYILRELIGSFVFAFCAVLAVCLVGTMFQVFRTFPGLDLEILLKALPLATGAMASWVILVASCVSCTLVYARLSAENEITAMRTCGIHTWKIISPAVLLGVLLVGMAYPLNEVVVPFTRHMRRATFREATVHALRNPPPGDNDFKIGPMRIKYNDYQEGRMIQPMISKWKGSDLVMEFFAPSGVIDASGDPIRIILTKPRGWQIGDRKVKEEFSAENDFTVPIPLEDLENLNRQLQDEPSGTLWEKYYKSEDSALRKTIFLILHTRYASSIVPMLLVLTAVPIGILVRRGSRLAGLGAALPPLLIYFVSYFIFQGLGTRNRVPPLTAAYAPDLFLAAIAAMLLWGVFRR